MEKYEIRVILHNYWKKGFEATEEAQKICQVEGEATVLNAVSQYWYRTFKKGEVQVQDQPRTGLPKTVDSEALRDAAEANPSSSTRRLTMEFGI